jgi:hypothetical protein
MNICEDPLFLRPKDFQLSPLSPAVDAGTTNRAPAKDSEGRMRGLCPDIGCEEVLDPLLMPAFMPNQGVGQITLIGGRAQQYSIEHTLDLQHWRTVITNILTTDRVMTIQLPLALGEQCGFYRARHQ